MSASIAARITWSDPYPGGTPLFTGKASPCTTYESTPTISKSTMSPTTAASRAKR